MNISHIRKFSKLAVDYSTAFDSSAIKNFFSLPPNGQSNAFSSFLKTRVQKASSEEEKTKRKILIESLHKQHSNAGTLTQKVEENLKFLKSEKCCAVVTGQQVGILGGPLYTIYKALHTIILANQYRKLFSDYYFVPVFWQETEDHDFEETAFTNIITSNFELREVTYQPSEDIFKRQVGSIQFEKEALERFFSEIESFIPRTDFTDEVLAFYKSAYQEDFTFAEAQAQLLGELLSNEGLLILNANTPELKAQATHLFNKELQTAPQLSESINRLGKDLMASDYHAQLDQQGMNLFLSEEGKRFKLSHVGDNYSYNDKSFSSSEMQRILSEHPERFSMNVAMRPLVQDTILPTAAYIAGPSEIAYFAQLKPAYEWAEIPMPRIVPRIGLTIIEDRFEKLFEKYNISAEDFLARGAEIIKNILQTEQEKTIADAFSHISGKLDEDLETLRGIVSGTDATLDSALSSLKGKILTQVKDFESKSLAAERKKQAGAKQQFEKAMNVLLPNGKLQERELNLLYFLNKYGKEFWKKLKEKILANPPDIQEHSIVKISDIL